ncbi:MAG: Uncharacterized protein FD161_4162 [Limisphaerales bacterium]|nr:MAG: Uncharacterized protein FD161_4162 [Limisphaerales bacterium]KAG0507140.1 MAG: Uncharacterized protein E1N63_3695 [Limisphaerales bacterium]TXT47557.1 MAG: Uncharacterized protein FD140_4199 [Limisphaerales bacterium]
MPTLQEMIHSFEEGAGARAVKWIGFLAGFLLLAMAYDLRAYKNLSNPDAMDAAQVARNLAEGKGFTTQFIRPASLYLVGQKTGAASLTNAHPDLANAPAYPALLAGAMRALPFDYKFPAEEQFRTWQPEQLIAWVNQGLFLLAVFLAWRLARHLFDPTVAWLSAAVIVGSDLLWHFSISGLSTMLALALLMLVANLLVAAERGARETDWGAARLYFTALLAGALMGALGLARYALGCLILPVMLYFNLFFAPRSLSLGFAALLGFAAVMAPWLMRNHELSGRLFGVAGLAVHQVTDRFPSDRIERLLDPENKFTHEDLRQVSLDEHWAKLGDNLPGILQNDLPRLGGSWVAAFFLAGLLVPFRNPALGRLRVFVLFSLGVLVVIQSVAKTHVAALSPDVNSENLLVVLAPLVFVFGTGLFVLLMDQLELPPFGARGTVIGLFLLVACAPMLFALGGTPRSPMAYPPYHPQVIHERASWLGERELMMSDMPWAVAWYGRRDCVWLPSNVGEGFATVHRVRPVAAIYLTALTLDQKLVSELLQGDDPAWGDFAANAIVKREIPEGFPLKFAFAEGFPYQLFLADRERWKVPAK